MSAPYDMYDGDDDVVDVHLPDDREPGEPEQEPPVNLDEVAALLRRAENAFSRYEQEKAERDLIEVAVPQMIDEIGDLRLRIAEWEALEKREKWSVTGGPDFPAEPGVPVAPAESALGYARRHKDAQAWRRTLTVHPWEPIDTEPPF